MEMQRKDERSLKRSWVIDSGLMNLNKKTIFKRRKFMNMIKVVFFLFSLFIINCFFNQDDSHAVNLGDGLALQWAYNNENTASSTNIHNIFNISQIHDSFGKSVITDDKGHFQSVIWDQRTDPNGENATYRYISMVYGLNDVTAFKLLRLGKAMPYMWEDRKQTLNIKNHPGMYEMNPILGRHPSDAAIIAYFTASAVTATWLTVKLPEPWASSLADSILFTEKMVTEQNSLVFEGRARANKLPIGVVLTLRF